MKKVIQESVERVDEKLSSILEGYASRLEDVFSINLQEACKKVIEEKEEEEDKDEDSCEKCECDPCECEKVEENVRKNRGDKEEVTFRKSKTPDAEKVGDFSDDGNKTDGDSGYDEVKPSAETPDKEGESARKKNHAKDNQGVPGKEGNASKSDTSSETSDKKGLKAKDKVTGRGDPLVKEGYSEFKKDNPKLDSTKFTKDKKGTDPKTPGFEEEGPEDDMYDDDVNRGATDELAKDSKLDDTHNMGSKEKDKPGEALKAKKKRFPSKNPKVTGTPGSVND